MNAQEILKQMTLEEKAAFCSGRDFWHTKAIERLGVPSVMMCDGPHGLRKQEGEGDHLGINKSIETVCYPTAAALASSFDREVMADLGEALGKVDKESINDTETISVSVTVKNVGSCYGKTAAQLYVRDVTSTVRRPVRELKAFEKVALQPGESKEISFILDKRAFAY
ncbi:MAG: fibronectin type III-like domain-contianing protein [Clostridia bacterium]|nr:fibronectin type III-like domain-contianing protein [Clostridia bacterium]